MRTALVMVSNTIADPEQAWPEIHDSMDMLCQSKEIDRLRFCLVSPNELELLDITYATVEVRLLDWSSIKSWTDRWMTDLLLLLGTGDVPLTTFAMRVDKKQSPTQWRLERIDMLILVRDEWTPGVHAPLLEAAWDRDITVVRIAPLTGGVFRVNRPVIDGRKEE